jgi:hypothetical protein
MALLTVYDELDVSGGKALSKRPRLGAPSKPAKPMWSPPPASTGCSLSTQAELMERVERAGGQVLAVDVGRVTNGSAGQWLSGTIMGAVSEYYRRSIKERSAEAQARAVARGAMPWARVPIG